MRSSFLRTAAVLSLPLLLASCAELFQGKVSMGGDYDSASLSDVVVPPDASGTLSPPVQLFVSDGDSPTEISVSWTPVQNALSYRLERAVVTDGSPEEPDESEYSVIILGGTGSTARIYNTTTYTDTILSGTGATYSAEEYGYRYYYRVCAENELRGYEPSGFTNGSNAGTLFAPVPALKASAGASEDAVELSWQRTPTRSALSYEIYRSENEDGTNAAFVTSVPANMDHFSDTGAATHRGTAYYYYLQAVNKSGKSCRSALAMGYARAEGAPEQVQGVKAGRAESKSQIAVSWTADADTEMHYAVYRSSSRDSALTLITADTQQSSLTDTKNLSAGVYYYYQVQSWKYGDDGEKVKGQMSSSGSEDGSPAEGFLLSPPTAVSVRKGNAGHTVSWESAIGNASEQASYTYAIYGADSADALSGQLAPLATVPASAAIPGEDGTSSWLIPSGSEMKYYAVGTVLGGSQSDLSAVTAPAPYAPQALTVSRYANLSSEMGSAWAANANEVYPVKLQWEPPVQADDVAGYIVYRSDKKDRGFVKLSAGNDGKTFIVTGTTFYDSNAAARAGKIYYYKVLSVNSLEQGTNFSGTEFGYGALTASQYMREYNKTIMSSQKKLTLMHKSGNTAKLGTESVSGYISGTLSYDAHISGVSGRVIMYYDSYADFYVHSTGKLDRIPLGEDDESGVGTADGVYFRVTGNTNTSAGMDTNGTMDGTVTCRGMYPGSVGYDGIKIKGGAAGGGTYVITREGFDAEQISWTVGNE